MDTVACGLSRHSQWPKRRAGVKPGVCMQPSQSTQEAAGDDSTAQVPATQEGDWTPFLACAFNWPTPRFLWTPGAQNR